MGDPAGIGPEIVFKALRDPRVRRACQPIIVGNKARVRMGRPSREAGRRAIEALEEGLRLAQSGQAHALVTAPVSKESFALAGYGFPGHTEWLAKESGTSNVAMLMVSGPLRAILMTRHVPLKLIAQSLTQDVIKKSARLGCEFARRQLIPHPPLSLKGEGLRRVPSPFREKVAVGRMRAPRLVLCGLNPHAGDHGLIGTEEDEVFRPAVRALHKEHIDVDGPLSADAVFPKMAKGEYDLALAAYHDQGMIPLKLYAPERVVNITLGLPFIRTSPGHGTAYDIAGKGKADARPMIEAILLAAQYSSQGTGDREP